MDLWIEKLMEIHVKFGVFTKKNRFTIIVTVTIEKLVSVNVY